MNMRRLLLIAILLVTGTAAAQTTTLLPQGGLGLSCNAVTASTAINPGLAGGCTSLALVTSGGTLPGNYTWQTITTGSPGSVSVTLVGSLDNVTWTTLDTNTSTAGSSRTLANANSYRFLGCVPGTLSGGASPTLSCQISVTSTAGGGGGLPAGLTFSSPTLTISSAGNGNGALALSGNTSGTVTHTAAATANGETITGVTPFNLVLGASNSVAANITFSSSIQAGGFMIGTGGGATSGHALGFWAGTTTPTGTPPIVFQDSTNGNGAAGMEVSNVSAYGWPSGASANGLYDTTLCRNAAGVVEAGTSVCNSSGIMKALRHDTDTNCASSAGTCGSASSGSVSIAAAASTVTVATTSVTANSVIILTRDDTLGTKLTVTCNTATAAGDIKVSTRTGGTSFVITVQNSPVTNPLCLNYVILN
jgi:hypothetical protein